jgi:hypothetical protein
MKKTESDLVEIIRLYAPESELQSGSWKKDHGACRKVAKELVSSCKHDLGLDAQAFFLRCPADRPKWPAFLAIDGATMGPKVPAHAHKMHGPLEPFGTLLTGYSDLSAANDGWAKMNTSGIVERLLGPDSALASVRIERLRMLRAQTIISDSQQFIRNLDPNRTYLLHVYTYPPSLNVDGSPKDANTAQYVNFIAKRFVPGFENYTGCKVESFWIRSTESGFNEHFTSSETLAGNGDAYINIPEDKPPASFWITTWDDDRHCEEANDRFFNDPDFVNNLINDNPYSRTITNKDGENIFMPVYEYERIVQEMTHIILP